MSQRQLTVAGIQVVKTALALPQTATATLFTVAGGGVFVTGILGRITTAIGGTANNLSLGTTASSATSIGTATAITSKVAGTFIIPTVAAGVSGALTVTTGPAFLNTTFPAVNVDQPPFIMGAFFLNTDTITWTTSANDLGNITWYLWYQPVDTSAVVS